jgi:transketolase C-terminal domain/subunit
VNRLGQQGQTELGWNLQAYARRVEAFAEDHHPEGGLGSAVTDALLAAGRPRLSIAHLAVRGMPGSGSGSELLTWAGIDADHIATAARQLISNK